MTINVHMGVTLRATMELTEAEIRALDALAGYGWRASWKCSTSTCGAPT